MSTEAQAAGAAQATEPLDDPKLIVELPHSTWETIITLLGGYPYNQAAPLIAQINGQTGSQLMAIWAWDLVTRPITTAKQ